MQLAAMIIRVEAGSYVSKGDGQKRNTLTLSLVDLDTKSPLSHMVDYQATPQEMEAIGNKPIAQQKIILNCREFTAFGSSIRVRGQIEPDSFAGLLKTAK